MKKDSRQRLFEVMRRLDKTFINEDVVYDANPVNNDDLIKAELRKLFFNGTYGKAGQEYVENRIQQLLDVQAKWLTMARSQYNPEEIAKILFKYNDNLNK